MSPLPQPLRQRGSDHETPCLYARDQVDVVRNSGCQLLDGGRKAIRIEQEGRNVAKLNPRLGEVGDCSDQAGEIDRPGH